MKNKNNLRRLILLAIVAFCIITLAACAKVQDGTDGKHGVDGQDGRGITNVEINERGEIILYFSDGKNVNLGRATRLDGIVDGLDGLDGKDGVDGKNGVDGVDGIDGKSIYELYKERYKYTGTLEQWLQDVLRGNLDQIISYSVTLNANGGALPSGVPSQRQVANGRTLELPVLTREGYIFLGWYTGSDVTNGMFTDTTVVNRALQLVARWQKLTYRVVFVDYDNAPLKTEFVEYGNAAPAPTQPSRSGYEFDGWDTAYSNVRGDLTVKAIYRALTHTVSFNTNGGNNVTPISVRFGAVASPPANPVKSGYVFLGWYLANLETEYKFDYALNSNTTLYALWADSVAISSYQELLAVKNNPTAKYYLTKNINVNGNEWTPIADFSGYFDGNGYTIYNLSISTAAAYTGFFGKNTGTIRNLKLDDYVGNITFGTGNNYYGGLVAENAGTIENCNVIGEFSIGFTYLNASATLTFGGIIGNNSGLLKDSIGNLNVTLNVSLTGSISSYGATWRNNCYFGTLVGNNSYSGSMVNNSVVSAVNASSSTSSYASGTTGVMMFELNGGAIGKNSGSINGLNVVSNDAFISNATTSGPSISRGNNTQIYWGLAVGVNEGTINNSCAAGSLAGSTTDSGGNVTHIVYEGGFIGCNLAGGQVSNCYSVGEVSGSHITGGFVGQNIGKIVGAYTTAEVKGKTTATGGFVGLNTIGLLQKCFSTGGVDVSSGTVGRFVGTNESGTIYRCYYKTASALTLNGIDTSPSNTLGEAKSVAELQSAALLFDDLYWDDSVWELADDDYPTLKIK